MNPIVNHQQKGCKMYLVHISFLMFHRGSICLVKWYLSNEEPLSAWCSKSNRTSAIRIDYSLCPTMVLPFGSSYFSRGHEHNLWSMDTDTGYGCKRKSKKWHFCKFGKIVLPIITGTEVKYCTFLGDMSSYINLLG